MLDVFVKKFVTVKNIIFFVIALLFIIFLTKVKDIAILFFASYVVACSLAPLVDKMSKKINRSLASTIVLGGVLTVSSLFLFPLFSVGAAQIKSFLNMLPEHILAVKTFLLNTPLISKSTIAQLDLGGLLTTASGFTTKFLNESINFSMEFASAIVYFFAACIIVYYFLVDKDKVKQAYCSLFPAQMKPRAGEILDTISHKIGGYMTALLVTIGSVGVITTIGLMFLGVDYAILLGVLNAVLDIIPIVGPVLGLIVTMLVAYKMGAVTLVLIVLLFIFAQWAENNLVRPYIFGRFLDIHPLIIYFFLFVTAQYLGVVGVIFAPAIAATVCVLFDELYIKNVN